jgi:hypothetical protein
MKIGLIGLPKSGKTTIFNALTGSKAPVAAYTTAKAEPNIAVVNVSDPRVGRLAELYRPKKTIHATIEVVDFVGLEEARSKETLSSEVVQLMHNLDALAIVVRNFESQSAEAPRPARDLTMVLEELVLSDLMVLEKRIERILAARRTQGAGTAAQQLEAKTLERLREELNQNQPASALQLTADEERAIRGFGFLTRKPAIVVLNSHEANFEKNPELNRELSAGYPLVEFAGNFEMELCQLDPEEAQVFMQDMNITHSAHERLTRVAYQALGYISFFTVGDDEVRAWNLRAGETALSAAAAVHSDLARGFIRAECMAYEDLVALGSEKAVKEKGRLRLEGRDYPVKDGDILTIRYNV